MHSARGGRRPRARARAALLVSLSDGDLADAARDRAVGGVVAR